MLHDRWERWRRNMVFLWATLLMSLVFGYFSRHLSLCECAVLAVLWLAGVVATFWLDFFAVPTAPSVAVGCVVYHCALTFYAYVKTFYPRSRMG